MKKMFPLWVVAIGAAFSANAEETEQVSKVPSAGWYIGVDGVKSEIDNGSKTFDLDAGIAVNLGYDFKVNSQFVTGLEVEFINYGSRKMATGTGYTNGWKEITVDLEESVTAINVNIRPKYYINSGLYLGGIIGFGSAEYSQDVTKSGYTSLELGSESNTAMNLGLELGYEFESGWLLRAGMRKTSPEFFNQEIDITSTFIGLGYKF